MSDGRNDRIAAGPSSRIPRGTCGRGSPACLLAILLLVPGLALRAPAPLPAQEEAPSLVPLTLEEAVTEALTGNPAHRVAVAREAMGRAESRAATGRLLPRADVAAGLTRSVDPVFAFGTKLRQGRFREPDLAFDVLNDPDPITDWTLEAGARWSAVDLGRWAGRSAARERADAAAWARGWSRETTVFRTKALYFGAAGTEARLGAAEAAEGAARATFDLFRRRREEGLLTEADVLQAEAELRSAEARRAEARRDAERAREDLALHLGWDADRLPVPSDTLPAVAPPDAVPAEAAGRADVRSLAAARSAARAEARRATFAFLPVLEAFARWTSHAGDAFDVDGSDWTAGVGLRWTLFSGLERAAERQRAARAREIAEIRYEDAARTARSEAAQAHRDAVAVWTAERASRAAARAAEEARILVGRRFEEGLVTAAELLQAEARASDARSRAVEALAAYNVALARLELAASGACPGPAGTDREDARGEVEP